MTIKTAPSSPESAEAGLGFAVARELAFHVILAARDRAMAEVNAVDPGNTAPRPRRGDDDTDRSAAESARDVVRAAIFGVDGPSGVLFVDGRLWA